MRFLGIDYGERRIGLARGNEWGIATPLPAVHGDEPDWCWRALAEVLRREQVDEIVLGHPLRLDGSASSATVRVERFAEMLRDRFGLPVHLVDETLSSEAAAEGMNLAQMRAAKRRGEIDSRAAAILLQDYLNRRFPPLLEPPAEEGGA
jgi:putative Holliday junction resolvase